MKSTKSKTLIVPGTTTPEQAIALPCEPDEGTIVGVEGPKIIQPGLLANYDTIITPESVKKGKKKGTGFANESPDGISDEWYTPSRYTLPLGPFDCDPCSPADGPLDWITATQRFTIHDDGLAQAWDPDWLLWCNPPYSNVEAWVRRCHEHFNGFTLIFNRSDTHYWQDHIAKATLLCMPRGRIKFVDRHGKERGSSQAPSIIAAYGPVAAERLLRAGFGFCAPGENQRAKRTRLL